MLALGRLKTGEMNKTEAAYAAWLDALQAAGEIQWHRFEGLKLRLANNTFYTPDFAVMAARAIGPRLRPAGFRCRWACGLRLAEPVHESGGRSHATGSDTFGERQLGAWCLRANHYRAGLPMDGNAGLAHR